MQAVPYHQVSSEGHTLEGAISDGKGNLLFRLRGKQAFGFNRRSDVKGVRLVLRLRPEGMSKEERFAWMQARTPAELFEVKEPACPLPEPARLMTSRRCSVCGEMTMESMLRLENGQPVCLDCWHPYTRFGL